MKKVMILSMALIMVIGAYAQGNSQFGSIVNSKRYATYIHALDITYLSDNFYVDELTDGDHTIIIKGQIITLPGNVVKQFARNPNNPLERAIPGVFVRTIEIEVDGQTTTFIECKGSDGDCLESAGAAQ